MTTATTETLAWRESRTEIETRRYAEAPGRDGQTEFHRVKHSADFTVKSLVPDMLAEFSRTVAFSPVYVRARWVDGVLMSVTLSGPRRLVSGDLSDNASSWRKREFRSYRGAIDRTELSETIAQGITAYEQAVAGVAANGGDPE
ncbi:hypothetical protein KNV18_gp55 [Mycobacterium phage Heath]|uniref:Uncharacterized protein n=1 Tax=Mycobacterium phage Heath TaxID=2762421 RepID=A0A7G8LFU8_9CAUD|nr:hypothetical protein KNV18_gp55 [Mycobacterium phage Heath]QNJ56120.1 hypothetical protein SEA_HEATH_55 [Mycobacterium phage Heath]